MRASSTQLATSLMWLALVGYVPAEARAQNLGLVVRDGSLGAAPPGVVPAGIDDRGAPADYLIRAELGEQAGGNLFHSFEQLSVGAGEVATFTGPTSVENVVSRVTGGEVTSIDGTLRSTIDGADVYLLNPSGLLFGPGARLDLSGSFYASTSDYLSLGEGGERLYADRLVSSVLSVESPVAFGFLGAATARGVEVLAGSGRAPAPEREFAGLEVSEGETLMLVGQDDGSDGDADGLTDRPALQLRGGATDLGDGRILALGAGLRAPGGRIELVGVGSPGEVPLPQPGAAGGSEALDGFDELGSVRVSGASSLSADGDAEIRAGEIHVRAGRIELLDNVEVSAAHHADGQGGGIELEARERILLRLARVLTSTSGAGPGGDVELEAPEIELDQLGRVMTLSTEDATGAAGSIRVTAPGALTIENRLDTPILPLYHADPGVEDGPESKAYATGLLTEVAGAGGGGDIRVDAGQIRLGRRSAIQAKGERTGAGGDIVLEAGRLELADGGIVRSFSDSSALGGDIRIEAVSLAISGHDGAAQRAGVETRTEGFGAPPGGGGGRLHIEAREISVVNGGRLLSISRDNGGPGGAVHVEATQLAVAHESEIASITQSPARSGDVEIVVPDGFVRIHGNEGAGSVFPPGQEQLTGIFARTQALEPSGRAGNLRIEAGLLQLEQGALVSTISLALADAGALTIDAGRVAVGGGSVIESGTVLAGAGGSLDIRASDSVRVGGRDSQGRPSRIGSVSLVAGQGSDVSIQAPLLRLEGGVITTTAAGLGNITVVLGQPLKTFLPIFFPGIDFASDGSAGSIFLDVGRLEVSAGGEVDSSSIGNGDAGGIEIRARELVEVSGAGSGIFSRPGNGGTGRGITIQSPGVRVVRGGTISVEADESSADPNRFLAAIEEPAERAVGALERELEGALEDAPESVKVLVRQALSELATLDAESVDGIIIASLEQRLAVENDAGDIRVGPSRWVGLDDGTVTASVGGGPSTTGGQIEIASDVVSLEGASRLVANAAAGTGGNIRLRATLLLLSQASTIAARSELGIDGTVEINAPDTDLAGQITKLPESFLDASSLLGERCAARGHGAARGSFAVRDSRGLPAGPDGMLPGLPDPARGLGQRPDPLPVFDLARAGAGCPGSRVTR